MDEADRAQIEIEREIESKMRAARMRLRLRDVGPFTSYCYWCGARVKSPRRWCDAECRDDWERAHARARS